MHIILTLDKAVALVRSINAKRISASISYLPVGTNDPGTIAKNVRTYTGILDRIRDERLDSDITVKLHQLGIYKRPELAADSIETVVGHAARSGNFVWIDMERPATVDATIGLFERMWKRYRNVGICLQAYLRRTEADMDRLLAERVPIRLVKGFYRPHDIRDSEAIAENFGRLMEPLLQRSDRPCIATHDTVLIKKAVRIIRQHDIANAEFQFFAGERDALAEQLTIQGHTARIYVPYGNVAAFLLKGLLSFDLPYVLSRLSVIPS